MDFKKLRKNLTPKNLVSHYKSRYKMPRKFLLELSLENRDNIIIVDHFLFLFGFFSLLICHIKYLHNFQEHITALVYFTFYFSFSLISLIWCIFLKKRPCRIPFWNNFPLLFSALSCIAAALYVFFCVKNYLSGIILLGVISVLTVVLFNIEPLYFVIISTGLVAVLFPTIHKVYGLRPAFDLALFGIVLIWLAYFSRRLSIKEKLKNEMLKLHKEGLQYEVEEQFKELSQKEKVVSDQQKKIIELQNNTIIGLSNLVENRDSDTGEHVRRTAAYVEILSKALQKKNIYPEIIDDHFIELAVKAAPMHDIGKIVVPDSILKKPGKLTPEEFEQIKRHTTEGGKIVTEILGKTEEPDYVKITQEIVSGHHEKWDGTGYPKGLMEYDIPLSARIMAVADVFDALVSPRCYKEPISIDDAFGILEEGSGSHFDPILIPVFLSLRPQIEEIMFKYQD